MPNAMSTFPQINLARFNYYLKVLVAKKYILMKRLYRALGKDKLKILAICLPKSVLIFRKTHKDCLLLITTANSLNLAMNLKQNIMLGM